jgi:hypothetical protein
MYEEENLTPAEQALESALGQLKPVTNIMNRDKLMFNAGRASIGKKQPWQILSGVLTVLLLCSILIHSDLRSNQTVPSDSEQNYFQVAQTQYEPAKVESPESMSYPKLRENIIKHGMDALQLQETPRHSEPARNQKQWMDSMLSS